MKKNKLNNNGFVLIETLIVSVFIMSIFAILYNNFYPLMGEYEKRESYDDIEGKYAAYWIKRIIQHNSTKIDNSMIHNEFTCDAVVGDDSIKALCEEIVERSQIENIYITYYNLEEFKELYDDVGGISGGMHRYLRYLPDYKSPSENGASYRIIVEFHRTRDDNDYLAYSTIEVKK